MKNMKIYFEAGGRYITAAKDFYQGVLVRCDFDFTDCGEEENLNEFVERHGGAESTAQYLSDCYSYATRIRPMPRPEHQRRVNREFN